MYKSTYKPTFDPKEERENMQEVVQGYGTIIAQAEARQDFESAARYRDHRDKIRRDYAL